MGTNAPMCQYVVDGQVLQGLSSASASRHAELGLMMLCGVAEVGQLQYKNITALFSACGTA